ncbi:hypothetical protein CC78DRAFT_190208 [Lojkania enalia]|uniref:RNA methyltransferase n=1 Tax=Lojkania enalia TaxID=147567 RepID=A0A9P4NBF2_9PLEO|nr:hypothetical protein CC78DRAFT_190208 [Didymosphaeria enalia]
MHVHDARLTLLNRLIPGLFRAKTCLDIGCNDGSVSCQLAFDFGACSVTGVDIDPELVSRAGNLFRLRASRVRPAADLTKPIVDYFPASVVLGHGYRLESDDDRDHRCPALAPALCQSPRVNFISADWAVSENAAMSGPYDVILALSVIKWVHLEHSDEGLLGFFAKCSSSLVAGGYLVLELQPWESYEKAVKRNKAPHYLQSLKGLNYRPETSFTDLLQRLGMNLYVTSEALPRRISVYRKE